MRDAQSGRYRRTRLFVLTLGYSRKSVRLLVFRSSSQTWAELHEKAFRRLGGTPRGSGPAVCLSTGPDGTHVSTRICDVAAPYHVPGNLPEEQRERAFRHVCPGSLAEIHAGIAEGAPSLRQPNRAGTALWRAPAVQLDGGHRRGKPHLSIAGPSGCLSGRRTETGTGPWPAPPRLFCWKGW